MSLLLGTVPRHMVLGVPPPPPVGGYSEHPWNNRFIGFPIAGGTVYNKQLKSNRLVAISTLVEASGTVSHVQTHLRARYSESEVGEGYGSGDGGRPYAEVYRDDGTGFPDLSQKIGETAQNFGLLAPSTGLLSNGVYKMGVAILGGGTLGKFPKAPLLAPISVSFGERLWIVYKNASASGYLSINGHSDYTERDHGDVLQAGPHYKQFNDLLEADVAATPAWSKMDLSYPLSRNPHAGMFGTYYDDGQRWGTPMIWSGGELQRTVNSTNRQRIQCNVLPNQSITLTKLGAQVWQNPLQGGNFVLELYNSAMVLQRSVTIAPGSIATTPNSWNGGQDHAGVQTPPSWAEGAITAITLTGPSTWYLVARSSDSSIYRLHLVQLGGDWHSPAPVESHNLAAVAAECWRSTNSGSSWATDNDGAFGLCAPIYGRV